ncbi:MAG: phosphoribosylglycinamide formyltransferase [Sumerlaeia bacterium]
MKIGVLISGRGSNLEALLKAKKRGQLEAAEFVLVVSNNPDAPGLERARERGIPTLVLDHRSHRTPDDRLDRAGHEAAVVDALREAGADAVVLAGWMRIVGERLLAAFPGAIINIHPSLLPSFPGLHAQRQALDHGVKVTGCTVHFVDDGMDTGPIIVQRAVPILETDDEASLSTRLLREEHGAIVEAVDLWSQGRLAIEGRRVRVRSLRTG